LPSNASVLAPISLVQVAEYNHGVMQGDNERSPPPPSLPHFYFLPPSTAVDTENGRQVEGSITRHSQAQRDTERQTKPDTCKQTHSDSCRHKDRHANTRSANTRSETER
jgi:hypothetical protein